MSESLSSRSDKGGAVSSRNEERGRDIKSNPVKEKSGKFERTGTFIEGQITEETEFSDAESKKSDKILSDNDNCPPRLTVQKTLKMTEKSGNIQKI